MKTYWMVCFSILLVSGAAIPQQEFNTRLSVNRSKKSVIEKILKALEVKNKTISSLHEDYRIFLNSQSELGLDAKSDPALIIEKLKAERDRLSAAIIKANDSPEFANSANIEMFSDGVSKGSFRLLKIRIGEPRLFNLKRMSLPIYIYLSARGNALTSENKGDKNKFSYLDLLDPLGGTVNFSVADKFSFVESKLGMTHLNLTYQLCMKLLNGEALQTEKNDVFLNGYSSVGVMFETGAWPETKVEDMGIFWLHARLMGTWSSKEMLAKLFDNHLPRTVLGMALESGLFIKNAINFKFGVYKYFTGAKSPSFEYLDDWKIKFSLDYTSNAFE